MGTTYVNPAAFIPNGGMSECWQCPHDCADIRSCMHEPDIGAALGFSPGAGGQDAMAIRIRCRAVFRWRTTLGGPKRNIWIWVFA
jgi:hypothetical protein